MSCDPFDKKDAYVKTNWHNIERKSIVLKDGKSNGFYARYEGNIGFSAFDVESGLLKEETGKKCCDKLLLKCPAQKKVNGVAYFIECKSGSSLDGAFKQLKHSFDRLNEKYENWMNEYPTYHFRVCWKSKTTNIESTSNYRNLIKILPKGMSLEDGIKILNFHPEKGETELIK